MSQYDWAFYLTAPYLVVWIISSSMNATAFVVFLRNKLLHSATNLLNAFLAVVDLFLVTTMSLTIILSLFLQENSYKSLLGVLSGMTLYFMTMSPVVSAVISVYRYRTTVSLKEKKKLLMRSAVMPMGICAVIPLNTIICPIAGWGYFPLQLLCPMDDITTAADNAFTIYLTVTILIIPSGIITSSYYKIYKAINLHSDSLKCYPMKGNVSKTRRSVRHIRLIVGVFICVWMIYFIVLVVSVFVLEDKVLAVGLIHILVGASTISNSFLYVLMNKLYRKCTSRLIRCQGAYVRSYASRMLGSNIRLGEQRRNEVLPEVSEIEANASRNRNIAFLPINMNTIAEENDASIFGVKQKEENDVGVTNEGRDSVPPMLNVRHKSRVEIRRLHEKHESARRLSIMLGHFSSDDEAYEELMVSRSGHSSISIIGGNVDNLPKRTKGRKSDKGGKGNKKRRSKKEKRTVESLKISNNIYTNAVYSNKNKIRDIGRPKQKETTRRKNSKRNSVNVERRHRNEALI
ncbi:opsin-VA-like [Anneissia japonica]|uniref:opsin-VA-like n=1 Tax=Anneissia japonica TaxID=1529436 RepID=UPI001425AC03|nr:opsin-VA-like [Anneissia japonica]